jgi:WD40 repeat protein
MNIKRISCIVTIWITYLASACSPVEPIKTAAPEETDVIVEAPLFEATLEGQEGQSPVSDTAPIIESENVITRQNAHTLTQIEHFGKGDIYDIAWAATGHSLALATTTGIYFVDPETYQEVHFTKTAADHIAFSPDGAYLASTQGSRIVLYDLRSESEPRVIESHSDISSIAFSPTENLFVSSFSDGTIKVWDLASGEERAFLDKTGASLHDLAFSRDGQILVSAAYSYLQGSEHSEIILWDVDNAVEILPETRIEGTTLAVSPTTETIATGGYAVPLRLLDFNGQVRLTLEKQPKPVLDLTFSPDGKILATALGDPQREMGLDTTLILWDTTSGEILQTLEKDDGYYRISFSPDGAQLAAAATDKVKLWDIGSGLEIATITGRSGSPDGAGYGTGSIDDFAWSPDGNALALATNKGITLINIQTHEETRLNIDEDGFSPNGHSITFSPDGNLLAVSYISYTTRGYVNIYDVRSQKLLFTLDDFNEDTFGIAFSPDNSTLATGWGNTWGFAPGGIKLWDVSTGGLIAEYTHQGLATIYDLTFNGEGNLLAATSGEGYVYIWDIETGQEIQHFLGTSGYGYAAAFSPDGKVLAVGGDATFSDATSSLRLIDLETEEILFDLKGHENWYVSSVAFNADGGVLASASGSLDGTVRLWDTRTGQQLAVLDVPGATRAAFSPDGTLLATAGYADVLLLWEVTEP